jgi:nitrogen fixation protein FixH
MTGFSSYRWFPWGIAGAMAAVVVVNLILTYFAFSSSTGLVANHPFTEGNGYNAILAAAARQDALGWSSKLAFAPDGQGGTTVTATLTGPGDTPLNGLSVVAHIERPVEPGTEIVLTLPETRPGHYAAPTTLQRAGQWDVRIVARRGDDLYEFNERIFVK